MKAILFLNLVFFSLAAKSAVSFESIRKEIQTKNLTQIEDVIANLPAAFRSNFILVYDSRSLQDASRETPRVIFFDPSGEVFLSVNGGGEVKGGNFIEMLEQNSKNAQATFHRITFQNGAPSFETNPPICFTCHTSFGHTLWDAYDLWPGIHGSSAGRTNHLNVASAENVFVKKFYDTKAFHLRYRLLEGSFQDSKETAERNEGITQTLYQVQAERLATYLKEVSANKVSLKAWLYPKSGDGFVSELPQELQTSAKKAFAEAIPYLCKRIMVGTARRVRRQIQVNALASGKVLYYFPDLQPLDAIARAYAISQALGVLDGFKDLSSPTLERESYVSNDGGPGFWGHFYGAFGEVPAESFKGVGARLKRENEIFTLSETHPVCGNFQWPEPK